MAKQIKMILTVDDAVKSLAEGAARDLCDGNVSAYIRGLVVFHQLLLGKPTGKADYPGWMLQQFPLDLLATWRQALRDYREDERASNKPYYNEDNVWVDGSGKPIPTFHPKPPSKKRK